MRGIRIGIVNILRTTRDSTARLHQLTLRRRRSCFVDRSLCIVGSDGISPSRCEAYIETIAAILKIPYLPPGPPAWREARSIPLELLFGQLSETEMLELFVVVSLFVLEVFKGNFRAGAISWVYAGVYLA